MGFRQIADLLFARMYLPFILSLFVAFIPLHVIAAPRAIVVRPANLPETFKLIGEYALESKIVIERGIANKMINTAGSYRIFSDGQHLRVYNTSVTEEFHSYEIYSSDGLAVSDNKGNIHVAPGMQARCNAGSLIKQLSITRDSLTLTDFPPVSSKVIVYHATRTQPNTRK